jgi:hypothetical protein
VLMMCEEKEMQPLVLFFEGANWFFFCQKKFRVVVASVAHEIGLKEVCTDLPILGRMSGCSQFLASLLNVSFKVYGGGLLDAYKL